MPEPDNKKLLEEVQKLLAEKGPSWKDAKGPRSVLYIPFKESEDVLSAGQKTAGQDTFREQAVGEQSYLTLRSFGKAVQEELTSDAASKGVAATKVTPENLLECFASLEQGSQEKVLNTTARKTPLILQHGSLPADLNLQLRPEDSVNVTGHGAENSLTISSESGEPSPDLTASIVVARLKGDLQAGLENGKPKIKLASCGSAGVFLGAFATAANEQNLPGDINVSGYQQDSVAYMDFQYSLDHLDKANRFVILDSVAEASGGPGELTAEWYAGRKALESLQGALTKLDEQVELQKQRMDQLPQPPEQEVQKLQELNQQRTKAAEKVEAKSLEVDETHKKLADSFFNQAERASGKRTTVSVRDMLKQMDVKVGQGAGDASASHRV